MRVEPGAESEFRCGPHGEGVDPGCEGGTSPGPLPDPTTVLLASLGATFEDVQQVRKAANLRAIAGEKNGQAHVAAQAQSVADALAKVEASVSRQLKKALRAHVLYPWLEALSGLAGPTTARVIGIIGHPHRFPRETGRGTGVRSLWHYSGLHVVNGRLPRRQKGVKADWNPLMRDLCLKPDGLADQIVRHRTEPYRGWYDRTKERLVRERGVEELAGGERLRGPAQASGGVDSSIEAEQRRGPTRSTSEGVEPPFETEVAGGPLRPIAIHRRARTVAVKRFLGDLLVEWKRRVGVEGRNESEAEHGPHPTNEETP